LCSPRITFDAVQDINHAQFFQRGACTFNSVT
jgi:hypothetical protein